MNQIKKLIPLSLGNKLRRQYHFWRGLYYSGSKFYCPFCDKSYRRFFTGGFDLAVIDEMQIIGAGKRPNMVCPGCASTDRDRLLHSYFSSDLIDLQSIKSVLHIAPEPTLSLFLAKQIKKNKGEYIKGVKYFEGFYYQKDTQLIDILKIPFPDNYFDLIVCNHVLEHIETDHLAMLELKRVLKQGGKAVLQVPWSPLLTTTYEDLSIIDPQERAKYFGQFDHVRLYGRDYTSRLESAGFEVNQIDIQELKLKDNYLKSISINPKEIIFVVTKQVF